MQQQPEDVLQRVGLVLEAGHVATIPLWVRGLALQD